jgi:DNA recombination protein RmuC
MAILNALQMGFRTLAIQKKTSEVWQLLSATKVEFQNFGTLMSAVEKQVGTVQNTIKKVNSKTRTINRKLKDVEVLEVGAPPQPLLVVSNSDEPMKQDGDDSEVAPELTVSEGTELAEDEDS